jgi:TatD DNase family protein
MRRLRRMARGNLPTLWDAHVHLPAYQDPDAVVEGAARRGMRLVSVTVSPAEARANVRLRSAHPSVVRAFVGVHPSEAAATPLALEELAPLWEGADGVGEVGLDPRYSGVSAGSAQASLFEGQVDAASRFEKPLEVHSRGAEGPCLDVLERYSPRSLLMHWFEGEELLDRALSLPRSFVSFGPALLYSRKLQRMARRAPPEAVLVESDGPVPFAALGGPEGPGLVPSVAFKLAELWGKGLEEAFARLSLNAERFLG